MSARPGAPRVRPLPGSLQDFLLAALALSTLEYERENSMALVVRCAEHGFPKRARHSEYVFVVEPHGGPNPIVHCGKRGCKNPGLVFMNVIDAMEYKRGTRTFKLPFHPAKQVTLEDGGEFLSEFSAGERGSNLG